MFEQSKFMRNGNRAAQVGAGAVAVAPLTELRYGSIVAYSFKGTRVRLYLQAEPREGAGSGGPFRRLLKDRTRLARAASRGLL